MKTALTLLTYFTFIVVCWFFYIAVMRLKAIRKELHPIAKIVAYYGLILGLALDVVLNLTASLILLDLPRELMFTTKLQRLKVSSTWRAPIARWICEHLLNQFDPNHC